MRRSGLALFAATSLLVLGTSFFVRAQDLGGTGTLNGGTINGKQERPGELTGGTIEPVGPSEEAQYERQKRQMQERYGAKTTINPYGEWPPPSEQKDTGPHH